LNKQKFPTGTKVKIADELPASMHHFPCGGDAIVVSSYAQEQNRTSALTDLYRVVLINDDGELFREIGYYSENLLTFISDDVEKGERLIKLFKI